MGHPPRAPELAPVCQPRRRWVPRVATAGQCLSLNVAFWWEADRPVLGDAPNEQTLTLCNMSRYGPCLWSTSG